MHYRYLGNTDLKVSRICLGTMTFGEQNTQAEGHQQLDYALGEGVNFIDTAELYAIPPCAETYGATETIIGQWLQKRARRDDIVLASKIAGPGGDWVSHIRGGQTRFDEKTIETALNNSLKRLKTDYIDLYQLHWPERNTNYFGRLGYEQPENEQGLTPIIETLQALEKQVQAGKIRHIGLSNETPWGIMTGKYLNAQPTDARLTRWPNYSRYSNPQAVEATRAYVELAQRFQLDPAQMALAFVNSRPFLTANIIGATNMTQLKNNIASEQLILSEELLSEITNIHQRIPNPAP